MPVVRLLYDSRMTVLYVFRQVLLLPQLSSVPTAAADPGGGPPPAASPGHVPQRHVRLRDRGHQGTGRAPGTLASAGEC